MEPMNELSKEERKKARRKAKLEAEKAAGRQLVELTDQAVEEALRLAPEVVAAADAPSSERVIDVAMPTASAARFALKRINEALAIGEWLDDVDAWVWQADSHIRPPLTEAGKASGVELRLEKAREYHGPD